MRKIRISTFIDNGHSLINETVNDTARMLEDGYLQICLDDILKDRKLSQKQVSEMTGLRIATISDIVNGKLVSINLVQIFAIMSALRLTDISDIFKLTLPKETIDMFEDQAYNWIEYGEMPQPVRDMYRSNVLKSANLLD